MLEDRLLIWRFKRGSSDALRRIYTKYENHLLTLATALLINRADAEDALHDVFVSLAQSADSIGLNGSLKSYLATCVVNRARDAMRAAHTRKSVGLEHAEELMAGAAERPDLAAICDEESRRLNRLLAGIPYEQREVVVLHVHEKMTFRQIADLQGASVNTVQGRYRYGLDKLRSQLAREVRNGPDRP
jgi:RNA polymerase sigma-70 factor (ECF subfamily)